MTIENEVTKLSNLGTVCSAAKINAHQMCRNVRGIQSKNFIPSMARV
jgi:hypothetical protein